MRRMVSLALLLWVGGCLAIEAPPAPQDAEALAPAASYRQWYSEVEACSGHTGAGFDRLKWYEVLEPSFTYGDVDHVVGLWLPAHTIYLAENFLNVERVVKHEMLHDVLQTADHPALFDVCDLR